MAAVIPQSQFQGFRGRLNRDSDVIMRTRHGKTHAYKLQNPYKGPLAESRKHAINSFAQLVKQCSIEMSDPERLAYWQSEFDKYLKQLSRRTPSPKEKVYSTLRGFIIGQLGKQE